MSNSKCVPKIITIKADVINDDTSGCIVDCKFGCLYVPPHSFPVGQKVKILIVKEGKK